MISRLLFTIPLHQADAVEPRGIERVEAPDELLLLYNPCSRKLKLLQGERERDSRLETSCCFRIRAAAS
jgi:hypothetical protein